MSENQLGLLLKDVEANENGVPQFPKGDNRRLFVLLAALEKLERPTMWSLAQFTGHSKQTIAPDVAKISVELGVEICKEGPVYSIVSWGELVKKQGVRRYLDANMNWKALVRPEKP